MAITTHGAILSTVIKDTSDAIREVNGTSAPIAPSDYVALLHTMYRGDIADFLYKQTITYAKVAEIIDGANNLPIQSLLARIVAVQTGSGVPSPDNVRPINGFNTCTISVLNSQNVGETTSIPLGDTYYGGVLNVITGELTVTHANIASYDGEVINEPWLSSMDVYSAGATPTTGAQVVYPLTEPITVQLTPNSIRTLPYSGGTEDGINNISASTGNIDITYIVNGDMYVSQNTRA